MRQSITVLSALAVLSAPSFGQELKQCKGEYAHPVQDAPYRFVTTTRYYKGSDHAIGYTCIENQVKGYFRFRWHVPGHYADFSDVGANELPRPLALTDVIRPLVGCFSYGNLSASHKSTFYGDDADVRRVELEKQGCPKTVASGSVVRPAVDDTGVAGVAAVAPPAIVPKRVDYEYVAAFFFEDPEKEKEVTRIRFKVNFEYKGETGQLGLDYHIALPPGSPGIGERSILLRPSGSDMPSRQLQDAFKKKFGTDALKLGKTDDSIPLEYPSGKRFGSARLIVSYANRPLSALWVPVLY